MQQQTSPERSSAAPAVLIKAEIRQSSKIKQALIGFTGRRIAEKLKKTKRQGFPLHPQDSGNLKPIVHLSGRRVARIRHVT